jgi:hypothetical protein
VLRFRTSSVQADDPTTDLTQRSHDASGIEDLLLAVSNDDNINMLTCLFGKRLGAKATVLRLKDATRIRGNPTFYRKNLLFDLMLSLEDLAAEEIVKTVRLNQAVAVDHFAEGKVQMRRFKLDESSNFVGVAVKDLKIPAGMLITAIDRDREVIVPGGSSRSSIDAPRSSPSRRAPARTSFVAASRGTAYRSYGAASTRSPTPSPRRPPLVSRWFPSSGGSGSTRAPSTSCGPFRPSSRPFRTRGSTSSATAPTARRWNGSPRGSA